MDILNVERNNTTFDIINLKCNAYLKLRWLGSLCPHLFSVSLRRLLSTIIFKCYLVKDFSNEIPLKVDERSTFMGELDFILQSNRLQPPESIVEMFIKTSR